MDICSSASSAQDSLVSDALLFKKKKFKNCSYNNNDNCHFITAGSEDRVPRRPPLLKNSALLQYNAGLMSYEPSNTKCSIYSLRMQLAFLPGDIVGMN